LIDGEKMGMDLKKNSSQIQCQNAKIQVFNSSLIKINMFASEHLVL
jgi:hypothetical protein